MANSTKKTRHTYVFELDEEELKVLANIFYRVQMGMSGPAAVASRIATEVDKYCYVDEYDPEGVPNFIPVYESSVDSPALYWDDWH